MVGTSNFFRFPFVMASESLTLEAGAGFINSMAGQSHNRCPSDFTRPRRFPVAKFDFKIIKFNGF